MHPFIEYRERLDSYRSVADGRLSDDRFVELVARLDAAVGAVDGSGFAVTPTTEHPEFAAAIGLDGELWVKDETGNVAGSHKARHLFGTAIALLVDDELRRTGATDTELRRTGATDTELRRTGATDTELGADGNGDDRLAIASCGNAALAAGVVAAAMGRPLDVFVPMWAEDGIVERLEHLGAAVTRCPRREGEAGDPAYLRFREAVEAGARSFSVQGTDTPSAFDGGRTLGWELADQLPDGIGPNDRLYLQVGGGAMATSASMGASSATLFPVQAEGCAPLARAWDRLAANDFDFGAAAASPQDYMWPWEDEPTSAATGILDDVTYDWLPLLRRTSETGGRPLVVPEELVVKANDLAKATTDIVVSTTGSAGLAGLLADLDAANATGGRAIVAFTGMASGG